MKSLFIIFGVYALMLYGSYAWNEPNDIFLDEKMETGYIDVGRGELFYWFFEPRNKKPDSPVLMWLTGGPGCSSSVALFFENGPFNINDDLTLKKNPYSWNNDAYVLFMDQPVGTGFSTVRDYVVNEEQIGQDMYLFLNKFFAKHPDLWSHAFYISGESYAGHYVPAIGAYILRQPDNKINLKGIAIGNGLVSPLDQYGKYSSYAVEAGVHPAWAYPITNLGFYICQGLIYLNLWPIATMECQVNLMLILGPTFYPFFNPYDVRLKCDKPPLCYDFSRVGTFLAKPEVRKAIGVRENMRYTDCSMIVHYFLIADWWFDFAPDVAYSLDKHNAKVMVYSGDKDFVCNWRGGEAWVHNFKWSGAGELTKMDYKKWTVKGEEAAHYKAYKNLSFVRILDAGHMAPMDKPAYTLEMINKFMFEGIH